MFESLNVDTYINGYNISHISCVDIPIAGASGYFNYDNYFFYCFYYSFFNNWTKIDTKQFLEFKNLILEKLGLEMRPNSVKNRSELIGTVKNQLKDKCPLIMIAKYKDLFYDKGSNSDHGILITGYDSIKSSIIIRDFVHIREAISPVIRADILCKLQLSEDIFSTTWEEVNTSFKKDKSINFNTIYSVHKRSEPLISTYGDIIEDLLLNYGFSDNKLVRLIEDFDLIYETFKDDNKVEYYRRIFHGSLTILFEVLEKGLIISKLNERDRICLKEFKEKYIKYRYMLLAKLSTEVLRGNIITESKKVEFISQIYSLDNELMQMVKRYYNHKNNHETTINI